MFGGVMVLLNIWSVGHFLQWALVGRLLLNNWYIFLALSVGWECLELVLPYEFAQETWDNKISDIVVNGLGFYLGVSIRQHQSIDD
jgi:glycopeptide antibiotics resistance protein